MHRVVTVCRRFSSQFVNNVALTATSTNVPSCAHISAACLQRLKHTESESSKLGDEEKPKSNFTGYIPVEELKFSYSRSSGPGGQNVNKVNTKVELRFHVPSASWISPDIKTKLLEEQQTRITKDGFLVISSDRTRKQILNQADVMDKLRSMLFKATMKPRGLTKEETELRDKRVGKSKQEVLREKRQRTQIKQSRGGL